MLRAVAILALVVTTTSQTPPVAHPPETPPKQEQPREKHSDASAAPASASQLVKNVGGGEKQKLDKKGHIKPPPVQPSKTPFDLIMVFTGVLALVAVLQFLAMVAQAKYMREGLADTKKAANAAKSAAETASGQLEAYERPWIMASFATDGEITFGFDNSTVDLKVTHTLKNLGHSIAIDVHLLKELFVFPPAVKEYSSVRKHQDALLVSRVGAGATLFPGVEDAPSPVYAFAMKEALVGGIVTPDPSVNLVFLGVVSYRFANSPRPHRTGFAYSIGYQDDPGARRFTEDFWKNSPMTNLVLTPYPGGQFAD
jgi:hypothetical protein